MQKKIILNIECSCSKKKKFPKAVILEDNSEGSQKMEVTCPICEELLSIEIDSSIGTLARMESMIKAKNLEK